MIKTLEIYGDVGASSIDGLPISFGFFLDHLAMIDGSMVNFGLRGFARGKPPECLGCLSGMAEYVWFSKDFQMLFMGFVNIESAYQI